MIFSIFKIFQSPVKWEVIYIFSQKLARQGIFIVKKRCKQKIKSSQSGEYQEVDDDDNSGGVGVTCTAAAGC